jgi:predicted ester cyclase
LAYSPGSCVHGTVAATSSVLDARLLGDNVAVTSQPRHGGSAMTNAALEATYRAYLTTLNDRRLDDLARYVHEELVHNGDTMTRRQYRDLIAGNIAVIPDLFFDAQIIVADDDRVACRILFDCTPQREFLGFTPNGERLTFAEHVSYHFRDGRIASVSSLIDRHTIQQQLSRH